MHVTIKKIYLFWKSDIRIIVRKQWRHRIFEAVTQNALSDFKITGFWESISGRTVDSEQMVKTDI